MKILLKTWFVLFAWGAGVFAMGSDTEAWLAKLSSGSALERDQAQRWLGLNLTRADYPSLAAGARGADAETGRRLALALASEPVHLGLALLFVGEEERSLSGIGRAAFDDLVSRWCPKALARPAHAREVQRGLVNQMPQTFAFGGDKETIGLHIDRLERHGRFGVPVVVEPGIAERLIQARPGIGRGLGLLGELATRNRLGYAGVGDWEGTTPGNGAWVLVSDIGGLLSKSGAERLLDWFRAVESGGAPAWHAARALARCGWPAALDWLDERWTERQDDNALAGLLAAASAGRASRSIGSAVTRRMLLGRADAALARADQVAGEVVDGTELPGAPDASPKTAHREVEEIARALIGAGGISFGGENQSRLWMQDWPDLSNEQKWLRFVLMEGQRTGGTSARDFLEGLIAKPSGLPAALRFQALRALNANPTRSIQPVPIGDLGALLTWAATHGAEIELQGLLLGLRVELNTAELARDDRSRIFAMGLACLRDDLEGAVEQCLALGQQVEPGMVQRWQHELERLQYSCGPSWLTAMAGVAMQRAQAWPAEKRANLELAFHLSGVLVTQTDNGAWLKGATVDTLSRNDYARLGTWAGVPQGKLELEFLVSAVRTPPADGAKRRALVRAVSIAHRRLLAAHEDRSANALKRAVWGARANPANLLHGALGDPRWPSPHPSHVTDLLALERLLPDFD